jgi:hypothetical protein
MLAPSAEIYSIRSRPATRISGSYEAATEIEREKKRAKEKYKFS